MWSTVRPAQREPNSAPFPPILFSGLDPGHSVSVRRFVSDHSLQITLNRIL